MTVTAPPRPARAAHRNACGTGTNDSTAPAGGADADTDPSGNADARPPRDSRRRASPFQPTPSLNTITSNQIQASQAQSFGNLFFTMPGATSAGSRPGRVAPGAARA